jgi:hypothetical protein
MASPDIENDDQVPETSESLSPRTKSPTPSPSTQKVSGAGPSIAEHSKDAKAPKAGRQPGAYVKGKR